MLVLVRLTMISMWSVRETLTLHMLIIVSSFSHTLHAGLVRTFLSYSCTPRAGVSQVMPFSYTVFLTITQKQSEMFSIVQTKT